MAEIESRLAAVRVATVIVNYRTPALALSAAASLGAERARLPHLRAVIVDGGSGDGSAEVIAQGLADPGLTGWVTPLPLAINGGFGWANNQAILRLLRDPEPPEFIHLLNPDAEIEPGALVALVEAMLRDDRNGAVGSRLFSADGNVAGSAFRFPSAAREFARSARTRLLERLFAIDPVAIEAPASGPVDWVTGASVLFRVEALRESGLFDTGFFLYYEELELMWRLRRAGWIVRHEASSRVHHVGGAATGVGSGGPAARQAPRIPAYMFVSRLRMLALTRGRAGAVAANAAWLAGHAIFMARAAVGLGNRGAAAPREGRDLVRAGLWPRSRDLRRSVARIGDPPDQPPAWME